MAFFMSTQLMKRAKVDGWKPYKKVRLVLLLVRDVLCVCFKNEGDLFIEFMQIKKKHSNFIVFMQYFYQ